jgi:hypothetical protein
MTHLGLNIGVSSYNHVLSSSSVSMTAGAIDLNFVPLGEMGVQTKFRSNLILGLATREPKPKKQKVL